MAEADQNLEAEPPPLMKDDPGDKIDLEALNTEIDAQNYRDISPACEDWKFVTNNTRIVVLPDPRLNSILAQEEDDQSSTGTSDHVQGEGLDDLTYDYEPGIALQHMEFANQRSPMTLSIHDDMMASNLTMVASTSSTCSNTPLRSSRGSRCPHCGVDYESGRIFLPI